MEMWGTRQQLWELLGSWKEPNVCLWTALSSQWSPQVRVQIRVWNVFHQCTFHPIICPQRQSSNSPSGALAKGKGKEYLRPWFLWLRRLISLHLRINVFHSSKDGCSNVLNRVCACLMGNLQEHLGTVALVHGKWQLTEQTLPLAN